MGTRGFPRPTNEERAAYFRGERTSTARQVGRGPRLSDRIVVRAALAVYRGLVWVHGKLQARRAR